MSEQDEASPGRRGGSDILASLLPAYHWLDASRCFDAEVSQSGWRYLIKALFAAADVAMRETDAGMEVFQVKEKLGSLRVYYRLRSASAEQETAIRSLVDQASMVSLTTCIICGAEGLLRITAGRLEVVCRLHSRG